MKQNSNEEFIDENSINLESDEEDSDIYTNSDFK